MIIEAAICFLWSAARVPYHERVWIFSIGVIALAFGYLFYRRFLRYGESFAKEVLKNFFISRGESVQRTPS